MAADDFLIHGDWKSAVEALAVKVRRPTARVDWMDGLGQMHRDVSLEEVYQIARARVSASGGGRVFDMTYPKRKLFGDGK